MQENLHPTVWRTLRVLANPNRLRVLQCLYQLSPQAVSQIAIKAHLSMSQASQILRALQARGLIQAERRGAWVFYIPEPNATIPYTATMAEALKPSLTPCDADLKSIIANLTAYTHERRIHIVRAIATGINQRAALAENCHLCEQALGRHLDKLLRRGVVVESDGWLSIPPQPTALSNMLLNLVLIN